MQPAAFHPQRSPRPDAPAIDHAGDDKLAPASHSYLEPRGEGILFAVVCLLASAIIYAGVVLVRFLT